MNQIEKDRERAKAFAKNNEPCEFVKKDEAKLMVPTEKYNPPKKKKKPVVKLKPKSDEEKRLDMFRAAARVQL